MMGLEIRNVPANWRHPSQPWPYSGPKKKKPYDPGRGLTWIPMHDRTWLRELLERLRWAVRNRDLEGIIPSRKHYRPRWREADRTHFQLYENVSEGTPLSPPMPSGEALAQWLAGKPVWHGTEQATKEDWLRFMERGGYAFSMVLLPERGLMSGFEYAINEEE